jgi:hypothetical protein
MSPKQWNAQSKVDGDVYADVALADGDYSTTVAGVYAGSAV